MTKIDRRARPALALLLALAIYFAIGLWNLRLPGLQYDEAADAVPAIQVLNNTEPSAIHNITLFGKQWPLMLLHHIGPTSIYTSLIGISIMGVSVEALRITQMLIGATALVLLWLLARSWFDGRVAALAVLLCASAPVFVWWSRAGANWTVPLLPLSLGMLLALTRWWRTGSMWALALAALCFGLGFTTKILFVWWVAPLAIAALIARHKFFASLRRVGAMGWLFALTALVIGLLPFLIHNIPNFDTFRFIASNAGQTRIYGHNNLDVLNNLRFVLDQFVRAMAGDTLHFFAPAGVLCGGIAFVLALIVEIVVLIRKPATRTLPRWLLVLTPLTVLPLSTVSTSSIGATYVFLIVPLAWLLIAVAVADVAEAIPRFSSSMGQLSCTCTSDGHVHDSNLPSPLVRGWGWVNALRFIAPAIAIVLIAANLITNIAILNFFSQTGGRGFWSDSVYALADTLQTRFGSRPIRAMDWGFRRTIEFLTKDAVRPQEMFEYAPQPSAQFANMSTVLLRNPDNVYLFHAPHTTAFGGHWEMFERAAMKSRKQLVLEQTLTERDGVTNTLIYSAQPMTRSFELPALDNARNATFSSGLTLLGGDVQYDPAKREAAIMLHWQSNATTLPDDTVLLHIVDQATGNVMLTADTQPVYGAYPFPQWQGGEVVLDSRWVTLPADLPAGVYQVRVGAYDRATGQRRAITDPQNDAAGDSLMLQTFEVK
jgi:4-amino-4-deoxy-L-arabinose transferase-like glycosyltransferase